MASASASPSAVHDEIDTDLSTSEIQSYLDDEAFELSLENDLASLDTDVRERLEVLGAAIRILDRRERATETERRESTTLEFEQSVIERLDAERTRIATSAGVTLPEDQPGADFGVF